MSNFEVITSSAYNLQRFLEMVQQDALDAKGCSQRLELPPVAPPIWEAWLVREAPGGVVTMPNGLTIEVEEDG